MLPDLQPAIDPTLDLVLERVVPVSPERIWRAWTTIPELEQWFCPKPWQATDWSIDLRPGGEMTNVIRGPDGESFAGTGCYLVVEPPRRLVFTDTMGPGFRPTGAGMFTAILDFAPEGDGCRYRAVARHGSVEACKQHADMGFVDGWGAALDQLVRLATTGAV